VTLFPPPAGDDLGEKILLTVILRLVLSRDGELEHGEVVDLEGNVRGRFNRWSGAAAVLRDWINSRVRG
jgi:hypothetical protein